MISVKIFVTERAFDFDNDFRGGLSQTVILTLFSRALSRISV